MVRKSSKGGSDPQPKPAGSAESHQPHFEVVSDEEAIDRSSDSDYVESTGTKKPKPKPAQPEPREEPEMEAEEEPAVAHDAGTAGGSPGATGTSTPPPAAGASASGGRPSGQSTASSPQRAEGSGTVPPETLSAEHSEKSSNEAQQVHKSKPILNWEDTLHPEALKQLYNERPAAQMVAAEREMIELRLKMAEERARLIEKRHNDMHSRRSDEHGAGYAKLASFQPANLPAPPHTNEAEPLKEWLKKAAETLKLRKISPRDRVASVLSKFNPDHPREAQIQVNANAALAPSVADEDSWTHFYEATTVELRPHGSRCVLRDKLHEARFSTWRGDYASVFADHLQLLARLGYTEHDPALLDQLKDGWTGPARDRLGQHLLDCNWEAATFAQLRKACYTIGNNAAVEKSNTKVAAPATAPAQQERHQAPKNSDAQEQSKVNRT